MKVIETKLNGVLLVQPRVMGDSRGYFFECYNAQRYCEVGIACEFVQDNASYSAKGVVRGLHYQLPVEQAKLIQVFDGAILDVAVDMRVGSPTFGKWISEVLSGENHHQLFIPTGFAHGFAVLGEHALVSYKCSAHYDAASEVTVQWNDPDIGVEWGTESPIISAKDLAGLPLRDVPIGKLPKFDR